MYADEADMLNMALFGKTANPKAQGNIRDAANIEQLVVLLCYVELVDKKPLCLISKIKSPFFQRNDYFSIIFNPAVKFRQVHFCSIFI